MTLQEIFKENKEIREYTKFQDNVKIDILTNITINQLKPCLENNLLKNNILPNVNIGNYDNIIQDSVKIDKDSIVIIFWEPINITEDFFNYIINSENYEEIINKVKNEILLIINNLKNNSLVIFNKFSHFIETNYTVQTSKFELFVNELNDYLNKNIPSNFYLVDIDKIFVNKSIDLCVDLRGFYYGKNLYTFTFLNEYSKFISPIIKSVFGKSKKAIILDCDNTLWKGIIGEDGVENIELSKNDKKGIYFNEIHKFINHLTKKGVIIGLCSKNNKEDVYEVFNKRKDFDLDLKNIIIDKINWENKASNLYNISKELNIGLNSIIFIDDSLFEIELINKELPEVKTILVPEKLYEYPKKVKELIDDFLSIDSTNEDTHRVKMYKENIERNSEKNSFSNIEDYIKSLEIKLQIHVNDIDHADRITQLSQKTNQFNLTTIRYTKNQILDKISSPKHFVLSLFVSDKYGESGITGVAIINILDIKSIEIESLFLSCRVLGRNIENKLINEILIYFRKLGFEKCKSKWIKTIKNSQTRNFYETNNFEIIAETESNKEYILEFKKLKIKNYNYINTLWKND